LRPVVSGFPNAGPPFNCNTGLDGRVCSRCGNGVCEDWELPCGCPGDCGVDCGSLRCTKDQYCIQYTPGPGGGMATESCVDIASDCPDGILSCNCRHLQACVECPIAGRQRMCVKSM
jgi:hypothetical protein